MGFPNWTLDTLRLYLINILGDRHDAIDDDDDGIDGDDDGIDAGEFVSGQLFWAQLAWKHTIDVVMTQIQSTITLTIIILHSTLVYHTLMMMTMTMVMTMMMTMVMVMVMMTTMANG